MKVVISCAGSKEDLAGYMQTDDGKRVKFVARIPTSAPPPKTIYATPDEGWHTRLEKYNERYNESPRDNPWNLYPAYRLYKPEIYRALVEKFGVERVYILSAGWGLIRADFLTPQYNITFSRGATGENLYKRREFLKIDPYFNQLPDDGDGSIVFFGGKDYIPLFCSLTEKYRSRRIVFHSAVIFQNEAPGCSLEKFGKPHTNWYYKCAKAFMNGNLCIDTN